MESDDMREAVLPYLNKLAAFDTEGEIADFLIQEGVKAVQGNSYKCAIGQYVSGGSGQEVAVSTVGTNVERVWTTIEAGEEVEYCSSYPVGYHTQAMRNFVESFDLGRYPELVASS